MKIGFDAKRFFENNTGLGVYSRTLVKNLHGLHPELDLVLFAPRVRKGIDESVFANQDFQKIRTVTPPIWERPFWRSWLMTRDIINENLDVYHGLSHELPLGIERAKCAKFVTIHDLIFRFFPKQYGRLNCMIYNLKFRRACEVSDKIIAVSENTRQDIISQYGVSADKIAVVYQTCDSIFLQKMSQEQLQVIRTRYNLPSAYLLSVGSIIARKNLLGLVQGWALLPESKRIPLVVVGRGCGSYYQLVKQWIVAAGLDKWVYFLHNVSQSDLPGIYQNATAAAYLSYYEGFGIPVLEAIASGTPVVTSNRSSMPEAAGAAALLVNPDQREEIALTLEQLIYSASVREQLRAAGPAHLKQFTAEQLTENLLQEYKILC